MKEKRGIKKMYYNDYYEIADCKKAIDFLAKIKGTDFETKEFTKKDFDKICKGTNQNHSSFSLDWLKKYGFDGYRVAPWWDKRKFQPFVIIARTEYFELPYKKEPRFGYPVMNVVENENGEIVGISADTFLEDDGYRGYIESKYGKCNVVTKEKETFTAYKHFYKANLEALKCVLPYAEKIRGYYENELNKAEKKIAKCKKALALY